MNASRKNIRLVVLVVVAVALAAFVGVTRLTGRARITGERPADRIASIGVLADTEPRGTAEAIATAAIDDQDAEVRRAAVIALHKFVSDHRETITAATSDRSPRVRIAAATALGRLADAPAVKRLGEMIDDNEEEDAVRAAAAAGLAGIELPQATVLLVRAMENHAVADVRNSAAAVLIRKFGLVRVKPIPEIIGKFRAKNRTEWLDLVETVKMMKETKAAFAKLDQPLVLHPGNLVKRNTEHERYRARRRTQP